ncbi:MAG TPA: glycosyl hydrolase family 28-related protein, partial [Gemmatimonadaceae bacterium]
RRRLLQEATQAVSGFAAFGALSPAQTRAPARSDAVNVQDFGAAGDGNADDTVAIQRAIDSLARGGVVLFPAGTYHVTRTLRIKRHGITLTGVGGHLADGEPRPTTLECRAIPSGADAMVFDGAGRNTSMKHVSVRSLYIDFQPGNGQTGGAAIRVVNCSNVVIDGVSIHAQRGPTSFGIKFGNVEGGAAAVIVSAIRDCTVISGTGILVGAGCTSVIIEQTFALGAQVAGYHFSNATYCSAVACAVDSGETNAFGYRISGCTGIVLSACGAESNGKGFLQITNASSGICLLGCRGVDNNTSKDASIGSLVTVIGPGSRGVTLAGCADSRPASETTASVLAGPDGPHTTILGYDELAYPKGIGGDPAWRSKRVAMGGGGPTQATVARVEAKQLPAWSPGLRGAIYWDTTNDRLVVYGNRDRKSFAASLTLP